MKTNVSSLGQGPGLAWKRNSSSFPLGSLAELQEWTGGKTEPPEPPWHGEVEFQQWNTIGWGITDDGILCIRPWEGDTGETGSVTTYDDVPWHDQALNINKVESIGTIVLNENSAYLFFGCPGLTALTGIEDWDVSNVTDMSEMFSYCSSLTDLSALANWKASKVTSMSYMFYGCSSLTDLNPLRGWNVSNVTNMSSMFESCSGLTALTGLSGWNVSSVTDMSYMFQNCSSLTDLSALANWDMSNVTSMDAMFQGCSSLQRIGIPSIENGGQKLVENAEASTLTTVLPSIISEDGSMGPYTWDEIYTEMTTNPATFQEGTVWVKAEEAAQ